MQKFRALFAKAREWLQRPPALSDKERTLIIHLSYLAILERLADPPALAALREAMRRGLSVETLKVLSQARRRAASPTSPTM
jgi:hypothetical protein